MPQMNTSKPQYSALGEYGNPAPRVKLPDVVIRKPIMPGYNSWALAKELENSPPKDTVETQPTNRDRYEDKSLVQPSSREKACLSSKPYIQPAVPLINTLTPSQKSRAVTDPVQFRSLLTSKKPSISQLKKKGKIFEFASSKLDLTQEDELPHPNIAPKALKVLGVEQESTPPRPFTPGQGENLTENALARFPSSRQIQDCAVPIQRSSIEKKDDSFIAKDTYTVKWTNTNSLGDNTGEIDRHHQGIHNGGLRPPKTPVLGNVGKKHGIVAQQRLHTSESFHGVIENASPLPVEEDESEGQRHMIPESSVRNKNIRREPSGEILRPVTYSPRNYNGVWGNNKAVDLTLPPFTPIPKNGHPNHEHVPRGLMVGAHTADTRIEMESGSERFPFFCHQPDASDVFHDTSAVPRSQTSQVQNTSAMPASKIISGDSGIQPQEILRSQSRSGRAVYSTQSEQMPPSHSPNGAGENAAHLHQPVSTYYAQHGLRQAVFDSRTHSVFDHPLTTANSWAPPQGNNLGYSQALLSAPLPPHWPGHLSHNPVPSPPASQQHYQRPSPLSAGLAQLDLTIHHHIDSAFGSLSRQIADRHDRVLDRVLLRVDNFEESIFRELKGVKFELKTIKKDISRLQVSVSETSRSHQSISKDSQILSSKLDSLERLTAQMGCKNHIRFADQSNIEFNTNRTHRQPNHRRTESAHGSLGGPPADSIEPMPTRQQNSSASSAASRSPSKIDQRPSSNGSKTSNIRSKVDSESKWQENGAWKASLVDLAVTSKNKVRAPDLRDHPAYRQHDGLAGLREHMMSMEEGSAADGLVDSNWYHQAYGKGI